jgi:Domain of unknown function (DUF3535)
VQLYAALGHVAATRVCESSPAQHAVATSITILLGDLEESGIPARLPEGVTMAAIDAAYGAQVLAATEGLAVPAGAHADAVAASRADAAAAIAALRADEDAARCALGGVLAAACVAWRGLPPKVNALIQPLMAAARRVAEPSLQREVRPAGCFCQGHCFAAASLRTAPCHAVLTLVVDAITVARRTPAVTAQVIAPGLAELVILCLDRSPSPNDKILAHLTALVCGDASATPRAPDTESQDADADGADAPTDAPTDAPPDATVDDAAATARRGAEAALCCLAERLQAQLPELLPRLWDMMTAAPAAVATGGTAAPCSAAEAQAVIDALALLRCAARHLHSVLHVRLADMAPALMACALHARPTVRRAATAAVLALAEASSDTFLPPLISHLLPLLDVRSASPRVFFDG